MDPKLLTVYNSKLNKRRLGKDNDGGYIICDLNFSKDNHIYDCFLFAIYYALTYFYLLELYSLNDDYN